ncbi:LutB/LldF family L-lactate oxidation iron-sulfur protein [Caldinitratiruptor microaerophilus]|uniref:Iron-sulfur cluster-binding protein n=1 Tax=Caldinitratiruptor microaerophilus TaxID=671077 RepID=A0AA35G7C6_9FIRM|nr:LutB/LldF family L-lactate oxidation iron-sulfur protein [Caldinitratiruptor microaerophilus]BDG59705.1 iron-sulfur cluster-binding protein [Caldinitratiruptor microaerophilus]
MAGGTFRARARKALENPRLRRAVRVTMNNFMSARRAAMAELAQLAREGLALGDFAAMRERARAIKQHTLDHLDHYLARAATAIGERGGHVHFAAGAHEVGEIVREIARRRGVTLAVKSKSMATEEVHLNRALQADGIEVVETDLGEYIIQLAGETPSHIVGPAIHKTREEIAQLFGRVVGRELSTDTPTLTGVARQVLREKFVRAGMGISGANFVVAETGTLCIVTNEGNGRLVTSAPPVHVAVVGIEKLVPTLADLYVFLGLLARSSTGQKISVYTHMITGPRRPGEADGPEELHVIFLDAGRSDILGTEYQEVLHCIRCGACLNHCPVYRQTGGHAYGAVYSGPVGTVLTPLLGEFRDWKDLPAEACSLCAACWEACPVGIPLHDLILKHRQKTAREGLDQSGLGGPLRLGAAAWTKPWAYRLSVRVGRLALRWFAREEEGGRRWAVKAPGPLRAWTEGRDLPAPPEKSFRELWAEHLRERGQRA